MVPCNFYLCIHCRPADDEDIREVEREDELPDVVEEEETPPDHAGYARIENAEDYIEEDTCIAYVSCLIQLARLNIPSNCHICHSPVTIEHQQVGTAVYLKWVRNFFSI